MKILRYMKKTISWIFEKEKPEPLKLKMYVLVRKELDETYRNVQGAHAAIEYTLIYTHSKLFREWHEDPYLIHLGVRFPSQLQKWQMILLSMNIPHVVWKEPDLDNQATAIACIDTGEVFKNLRLA